MPDSLRDKAAGLLIARLGNNLPPETTADEAADEVARLLDRRPVGGLIVFNGREPDTGRTLERLQALSDRGLLVSADMERGLGQQVRGGDATLYPHEAAFGHLPPDEAEDAVRAFAAQAAREAVATGIHVTWGPVADVDREPRNPIIGTRAFSRDPLLAARLSAAFVEGAHAGGQLCCAKHFPGHGGTTGDSHHETPRVEDDAAALEAVDLAPFRAAISAGVDTVMTAHVAYPALDPTGVPATASAPILRGLLRGRMGFDGAVVSDSLQMAGIRQEGRSEGDVAADLLAAGVDLFCDPVDPDAVVEGVARAVEEGRLDEARVDEALFRADTLRRKVWSRHGNDAFTRPAPGLGGLPLAEHRALADRVARGAIRRQGALPDLGDGAGVLVVLAKPAPRPYEPETLPFGDAVRRLLPRARYAELEPTHADQDDAFERVRLWADEAERVVVATVARPAAWHAFGLPERERRFVQRLLEGRPSVLAVLGGPRGLAGYSGHDAALVAYSAVPASQNALAEALAHRGVAS